MTKSVEELYLDKNLIKREILDFFNDKKSDGLVYNKLNETFKKLEPYLKKRFLPMNNSYCWDKEIVGCWLGLCKNNFFKYMNAYNSGTDLEKVVKEMRTFYKNYKIDIPTKNELKKLTLLSGTPFELSSGRPNRPGYCILYKQGNKVQGSDLNDGYLYSRSEGSIHPIFRLYKENTTPIIPNKKIFLLWIANKLKPSEFETKLYLEARKNGIVETEEELKKNYSTDEEKKQLAQKLGINLDLKFEDKFYDSLLEASFKVDGLTLLDVEFDTILIDSDKLIDNLKKTDKIRADLTEYDTKLFYDVNEGNWEVERLSKKKENSIKVKLDTKIVAKNPQASIIEDGIIGIDFGTKSTVVVHSTDTEQILPMRIGMGDWSKKPTYKDYENPTILEFINLNRFLENYNYEKFRPFTKWEDLTISHTAYSNMSETKGSQEFNSFLTDIKQWAGDKRRKIEIEDQNYFQKELPSYVDLKPNDLDPIEIYAYYLGLYINNQFSGIFLEYILSFPVTYEMSIRKKICESFKNGIMKSLPDIGNRIEDLRVEVGSSEPAAYAAVVLQEFNFNLEEDEKIVYGVFDFGGGTTDFDFGIFRFSDLDNRDEENYDYVIEHFGAGGDKFLGGENLLELLGFEIFKDNLDLMLKNNIPFIQPPETKKLQGVEKLISNSREAKKNSLIMMEKLRAFWERDKLETGFFKKQENSTDKLNTNRLETAETAGSFVDNNGQLSKLKFENFKIDEEKLINILKTRIEKGIDTFFESLREAFANNTHLDIDTNEVHIFLAGNSSKSSLVKEIFAKKIEILKEEYKQENVEANFYIYEPLKNDDNFDKPNGKTGVAFGLLETRKGGSILVIDENISKKDNEINFQFYLGQNRRKKFKTIIDKITPYNEWQRFTNAGNEIVEIYYTSLALATKNSLSITDTSIKKKRLKLKVVDKNLDFFIRLIGPKEFEYGVGIDDNVERLGKVELSYE